MLLGFNALAMVYKHEAGGGWDERELMVVDRVEEMVLQPCD
jgi:hypothetical protein